MVCFDATYDFIFAFICPCVCLLIDDILQTIDMYLANLKHLLKVKTRIARSKLPLVKFREMLENITWLSSLNMDFIFESIKVITEDIFFLFLV